MEARAAAWTLFGVVIGFKLVGALLILLMSPSGEAITFLVVMNWPFIVAAAVAVTPPTIFLARLVRARARRAELLKQEWRHD